jgi:ParB/RepB/Spo0J family partition protein
MSQQVQKVAIVPLANIRENQDALRPVDKDSEEFQNMVDSIKLIGITNPISVREVPPGSDGSRQVAADGSPLYGLVDGLHRFTAAIAAGLTTIPVNIMELDEGQLYEAQIIANVHKKETRPAEYGKAIQRIMGLYPTRTVAQQAAMLGKNVTWLKGILGLNNLTPEIQELVNEGKINQANAFPLSRIPQSEQHDWIERAMTEKSEVFGPAAQARVKELKAAQKEGRKANAEEFVAQPYNRKYAEIKDEQDSGCRKIVAAISAKGITNPVEIAKFILDWVTNMDEETLAKKQAEWQAKKDKQKADADKRAAEKAKKKGEEAAAAAEKARKAHEAAIAAAAAAPAVAVA